MLTMLTMVLPLLYGLPRCSQYRFDLQRTGNWSGIVAHRIALKRNLCQMRKIGLLHTGIAQVLGKVHLADHAIDVLNHLFNSSLSASAHQCNAHCVSRLSQLRSGRIQVEAHGMWQNNAIGYPMWHSGSAAQRVAETMMQCHCNIGKSSSRQKCTLKHLGTRLHIITLCIATRQGIDNSMYSTYGRGSRKWVACDRIESFNAMGQRVNTCRSSHHGRKIERQQRVIE